MSADDPALAVAGRPSQVLASALSAPAELAWPGPGEARRAAVAVACFVGLPALAAVGAVLALFALSAAVLLAPVVAGALTWAAWHVNRSPAGAVPEERPGE